MAVRDGVVAFLGSDESSVRSSRRATVVNLDGAFVAPAFVDSHVHTTATGLLRTASICGRPGPSGNSRPAGRPRECPAGRHHLGSRLGRDPVGRRRADHGRTRRRYRSAGGVSGPGRHALGVGVDRVTRSAGRPGRERAAGGRRRPRRPNRARPPLAAAQRAEARVAALDAFAAAGVVAVHECGGPVIGGRRRLAELLRTEHGVEVVGYWGETVGTAEGTGPRRRDRCSRSGRRPVRRRCPGFPHTAWLREPYRPPGCCGNRYLDDGPSRPHLSACTEARIPAGFHVIGDAAVGAVVDALRRSSSGTASPAVARCGTGSNTGDGGRRAGRRGSGGGSSPACSPTSTRSGAVGPECTRNASRADRAERLNPFALLASITAFRWRSVPDSPVTDLDPWGDRAPREPSDTGSAISARRRSAATRGAWRRRNRDGITGTLVPGAAASYAVWDADDLRGQRARRRRCGSGGPPIRGPGCPRCRGWTTIRLPRCLQTVHRGVTLFGELHA